MKTAYFTDESFNEIVFVMSAALAGQEVLIELLAGRFGPQSDQVKTETARLALMVEADNDLRSVSSWRGKKIENVH